MSVQSLYRDFREGNLLVNRKYQRKLVWSVQEKQRLIDSILRDYPIPLILLAEQREVHGQGKYEIIDGIQRLNAIFSFIENGFDYEGRYFDITELPRAKQASEAGSFKSAIGSPLLSKPECANFLDYHLAVTIYPTSDETDITDVFSRINSGGRQLSYQEQRQAGVVSEFARIVRTLASEIRGDVSKDLLLLSEMPEISVDTTKEPHGYGIKADETFWCKQGILSIKQLKESEDEQTLADIAVSIVRKEPLPFSRELLDKLYDLETEDGKELMRQLAAYGGDRLSKEMKACFSVLKKVIEDCSEAPNYLRSKVRPDKSYTIKAPFYAIFMAFFQLIVEKKKSPDQPQRIMDALQDSAKKMGRATHYETVLNRRKNISLAIGLIQDYFVDKVPPVLGHGPSMTIDFENTLRRSRIETSRYEFKQGIIRLDAKRELDNDLLSRLVETACGIANLGPNSDGYIFLGVADRKSHAEHIQKLDHITPREIAERFVVGIDREAKLLNISVEEYTKKVISAFQNSKLSEPLKTHLITSFDTISMHGLSAIMIRIPAQKEVSFVDDQAYIREGSSTVPISGKRLVAITKLFEKE
jgi:hypothetical protein